MPRIKDRLPTVRVSWRDGNGRLVVMLRTGAVVGAVLIEVVGVRGARTNLARDRRRRVRFAIVPFVVALVLRRWLIKYFNEGFDAILVGQAVGVMLGGTVLSRRAVAAAERVNIGQGKNAAVLADRRAHVHGRRALCV